MVHTNGWRETWNQVRTDRGGRFAPEARPLPTPAQRDLLRAALSPAGQAAPAWQRWKDRGLELQTVTDEGSMRLFPLLWANRDAAGIGPEDHKLLKGIYRHTIAYNAPVISNAINAANALTDAGVPVLFFKGAAILALAGDKLGLRRMADVDLLVPESDSQRAVTALLNAGYRSPMQANAPVGAVHAWAYRGPHGHEVDLHFWAYKAAGDDSGMFETAVHAVLLRQPVLIPSPSDCLVNTVANGFRVSGSPVRWIADSMTLFASAEIDWSLVLKRSRRPGLALALASGLDYLAREFAAPVPGHVLDELHRLPSSWVERGAHWAALNRPPGAPVVEQIALYRARRRYPEAGETPDFLSHLAQVYGVRRRDYLWSLPKKTFRIGALLLMHVGNRWANR
jgi:hypothetical protein